MSAVMLALFATSSWAVPPLVTGDVPTAEEGVTELFVGSVSKTSPSRDEEQQLPWMELVYGISDRQEVTFEVPHVKSSPQSSASVSGMGDAVIGTKFLLGPTKPQGLNYGMSVEIKLDNASWEKGLGTGAKDLDIRLRAQKDVGRNEFIWNLGYTFVGDPQTAAGRAEARNVAYWATAFCHKVSTRATVLAELYGSQSSEPGGDSRFAFNTGFKYKIGERQWLHFAWGSSLRDGWTGGPKSRMYIGTKMEF